MLTSEDVRRLVEGNHDLHAAADAARITAAGPLQAAVAYTRDRLAVAQEALLGATRAMVHEADETRAARTSQFEAAGAADADYRFVRQRVSASEAFNPPREAMPSANEMESRQKVFLRLFGLNPTDFSRQTPERKVVLLQAIVDAADGPLGAVLGNEAAQLRARLAPAAAELDRCNQLVAREVHEDRDTFRKLDQARSEFDRRQATHATQVEAALRDEDRLNELGHFIRAQDPAYRARRAAGQPIKAEEGVEAVTSALGVAPETIEAPPG